MVCKTYFFILHNRFEYLQETSAICSFLVKSGNDYYETIGTDVRNEANFLKAIIQEFLVTMLLLHWQTVFYTCLSYR